MPDRPRAPRVADERASLDGWLDFHRATLLTKCAGLEPEQLAIRSAPPSTLSLLGRVRHLTEVEAWFHDFDGEPEIEGYGTEEVPDACFDAVDAARAGADLATFNASVSRSRAAVAGIDLDEVSPSSEEDDPRTLRWIYLHMIEEYARHNGQADIIRERIDGVTED